MPEEMNIINLPMSLNLPCSLVQSFSLILLQASVLNQHLLSAGRRGHAQSNLSFPGGRRCFGNHHRHFHGVGLTWAWACSGEAGKHHCSEETRLTASLAGAWQGIKISVTEHIQAQGGCSG